MASASSLADHELLRRIGSGSYGEVWLARNALGAYRAVKIVYRKSFEDSRPFEREFNGIQKFEPISRSHEGLVDILQAGRQDDYFYYVMELADDAAENPNDECRNPKEARNPNAETSASSEPIRTSSFVIPSSFDIRHSDLYTPRTLRHDLKQRGRLPVDECIEIALALTSALAHVHKHGLVHRDIKPSNIIFVNGAPKLADIGLVTDADTTLSYVGTEGYIPPEGPGAAQADIFSLGMVLYEISTGQDRRQFPDLPPNLKEWHDQAAVLEFNEVLLKACARDARLRYQSAEAMRADLALLQVGKSVRRLRIVERRLVLLTRSAWAAGAVALVLGAGFLFAMYEKQQAVLEARRADREAQRARQSQEAEAKQRQAADEARQRAVDAQLSAQKSAYAADMLLAFQALENDHLGRLRELLGKYGSVAPSGSSNGLPAVDLRGWEWRYLWGRSLGSELFTLRGHSNEVWVAGMLHDGRTVLSLCEDGALTFWNTQSRSPLETLRCPDRPRCGALSCDGRLFAVGGDYGWWSLWDVSSRRLVFARTNSSRILSITIAPKGTHLALAAGNAVEIWDTADQQKISALSRNNDGFGAYSHGLAFSPDGQTLAYGHGDSRILLHDLASGSEVEVGRTVAGDTLSLAFSPDGRVLVSSDRARIAVWDLAGRLPPRYLTNHLEQIACVAFSPNGTLLASASGDQTIRLWDTQTWREIAILRGHEREVRSVSFSPDGKYLVSSGQDETVRVWSVERSAPNRDRVAGPTSSGSAPIKPTTRRQINYRQQGRSWESISFFDLLTLEESKPQSLPPVFHSATAIAISADASLAAVEFSPKAKLRVPDCAV